MPRERLQNLLLLVPLVNCRLRARDSKRPATLLAESPITGIKKNGIIQKKIRNGKKSNAPAIEKRKTP